MQKTVHLIGNAHLDPVWLWRFQDGLSEIKATFRSALDRIEECDEFIFTSACAFYYKWVEDNCPEMFEEIKAAVKAGRWSVVGGMWIQPDLNIPSAESLSRHLLYSQRYFKEKLGVTATCGYNVDSFGHSAGLPRLLKAAGIDRYVYMRPSEGAEKNYNGADNMFIWKCGESSVKAFRIPENPAYCFKPNDDSYLKQIDAEMSSAPHDTMLFYGVGNHGGGPTITNLKVINAFSPTAANKFVYSCPDAAFASVDDALLPVLEDELQNHASGCYAANSAMKSLNRQCENRLIEGEKLAALAVAKAGFRYDSAKTAEAWEPVMFNQFHDIMCGCATKAAYDDAYAFAGGAKSYGIQLANAAAQRISWAIDTSKGNAPRSKESHFALWESENMGTPIVVFNPLSHAAKVPVVVHRNNCAAITDEKDTPIANQVIRADYTNGGHDKTNVFFRAEVPAYGWRTFWVYGERSFGEAKPDGELRAGEDFLANSEITVKFGADGSVSIADKEGKALVESTANILINDAKNDTWAHNNFVFDEQVGAFGESKVELVESGSCRASIRVTQSYKTSRLEQTYTLSPNERAVRVKVRLFLDEPFVMLKHCVRTSLEGADFLREVPGAIVTRPSTGLETDGRELPMQRWMALRSGGSGVAMLNDSKYSSSALGSEMRMVGARSCGYGDHYGVRDSFMELQDLGEQEYSYEIRLFDELSELASASEELNTAFPVVSETYHAGELPQSFAGATLPEGVTVSAVKPAEDGNGIIVRLVETTNKARAVECELLGTKISCKLDASGFKSIRITEGKAAECSLCEE